MIGSKIDTRLLLFKKEPISAEKGYESDNRKSTDRFCLRRQTKCVKLFHLKRITFLASCPLLCPYYNALRMHPAEI